MVAKTSVSPVARASSSATSIAAFEGAEPSTATRISAIGRWSQPPGAAAIGVRAQTGCGFPAAAGAPARGRRREPWRGGKRGKAGAARAGGRLAGHARTRQGRLWTPAAEGTPQLVGSPDDGREGGQDPELGGAERGGAEEALQRRQVDERRCERDLEGDAPEQERVREEADGGERGAVGAGGERGPDLAGDDAGEGHRRRLQVGAVQGARVADVAARAPACAEQDEEEAAEDERGLEQAEEDPGAHHHRARDDAFAARARGPRHETRLARLATEGERGEDLGAEVDGEDLEHGQR